MLFNLAPNARGPLSNSEEPQSGATGPRTGASTFSSDTTLQSSSGETFGFLPSANITLLRTSPSDNLGGSAIATASTTTTTGTTPNTASSTGWAGPLILQNKADLVERSAFVHGLMHSERLVYDVHDAIAVLAAAASVQSGSGDTSGTNESLNVDVRGADLNHGGADSVLSGVFYFTEDPPCHDMPWRPTYRSAVLLCVFASVAACQRALEKLPFETVSARSMSALSEEASTPVLSLFPAASEAISAQGVRTALLSFLTGPQLTNALARGLGKVPPENRPGGFYLPPPSPSLSYLPEDGLADKREIPLPPAGLISASTRLYAVLLTRESPYEINWVAARDALRRGDGVVVNELSVLGPWLGSSGGLGGRDRDDVSRARDRRNETAEISSSTSPSSGVNNVEAGSNIAGGSRHAELFSPRHTLARGGRRSSSPPLTLQEEDYRRRFGSHDGTGGNSGDHRDGGGDGSALGLLPWRSTLYRGTRQVVRGISWVFRRLREGLGDEEAPLSSGAASFLPPSFSSGARLLSTTALPGSGTTITQGDRSLDEPPRQRYRSECSSNSNRSSRSLHGRPQHRPIVVAHYNSIGTALSWMPGFQYFGRLFVNRTSVLMPEGKSAQTDRWQLGAQQQPQQRPRPREEEGNNAMFNAAAAEAQTYQWFNNSGPMYNPATSWLSPGRDTGSPTTGVPSLRPSGGLQRFRENALAPGGHSAGPVRLPWVFTHTSASSFEPDSTAQSTFSSTNPFDSSNTADIPTGRAGPPLSPVQGETLQPPANAAASAFVTGALSDHMLGRIPPRPHCLRRPQASIRVEGVRSSPAGVGIPLSQNDESANVSEDGFLSRHRRRHGWLRSHQPAAGEVSLSGGSGVSTLDGATTMTTTLTHAGRSSFAEALRSTTQDCRESEGRTSGAVTPQVPGQGIPGVFVSNSNTSGRSSQRTVSFTLPSEMSGS